MNIVKATTLRNNFSDAVEKVNTKKDYLLISKRGKITSALVDIEFFEDLLALSNKNYLKSIKEARQEYETGKTHIHEEIFGEI